MDGRRAIEFTTQALATAATEVKGVEVEVQPTEEEEVKVHTPNTLKGSEMFNKKE